MHLTLYFNCITVHVVSLCSVVWLYHFITFTANVHRAKDRQTQLYVQYEHLFLWKYIGGETRCGIISQTYQPPQDVWGRSNRARWIHGRRSGKL